MNLLNFLEILERNDKKRFFFIFFIIFLAAIFELFSLALVVYVLTSVLDPNSNIFNENLSLFSSLTNLSLVEASVFLFFFMLFKTIWILWASWIQTSFTFDQQMVLSQKLLTLNLYQKFSAFSKTDNSEKLRDCIGEVNFFVQNFLNPFFIFLTDALLISIIFVFILLSSPILALTSVLVIALISLSFFSLSSKRNAKWGKIRQRAEERRIAFLQESFSSIKDVIIYKLQDKVLKQYQEYNQESSNTNKKARFFQLIPRPSIELAVFFMLISFVMISDSVGTTREELVSYLVIIGALAFKLLPSFNRILSTISSLRFAYNSKDLIRKKILEANISFSQHEEGPKYEVTKNWETIELKGIGFDYGGQSVINEFNLMIKKGEKIAILGKSGSGKTTLLNILSGLITPTKGEILIDGKILNLVNSNWKDNISFVPQDYFVFDDTLEQNIALGNSDRLNTFNDVISSVNLLDLIDRFKDSKLGQTGKLLSGGQQQRISIARAFYRNANLFILDEPTSALDDQNTEAILQALINLKDNKTVCCVTHDKEIASKFSRIINLDG